MRLLGGLEMLERKRPEAVIVLEALLQGRRVVLADRLCVLEGNELRLVGERRDSQTGESGECLLPFPMHVSDFLKACEQLSDDEVFILAAETALAKERR